MTTPDSSLVDDLGRLDGDTLVLGVGGKMGPTLAGHAKRAAPAKREAGVARLSEPSARATLEYAGVSPAVPLDSMIDWVADWLARAVPSLGKPT